MNRIIKYTELYYIQIGNFTIVCLIYISFMYFLAMWCWQLSQVESKCWELMFLPCFWSEWKTTIHSIATQHMIIARGFQQALTETGSFLFWMRLLWEKSIKFSQKINKINSFAHILTQFVFFVFCLHYEFCRVIFNIKSNNPCINSKYSLCVVSL